MRMTMVFANGDCKLNLIPESKWEKRLLGAIANGGDRLDGVVEYRTDGHYSHGDCELVQVTLTATPNTKQT